MSEKRFLGKKTPTTTYNRPQKTSHFGVVILGIGLTLCTIGSQLLANAHVYQKDTASSSSSTPTTHLLADFSTRTLADGPTPTPSPTTNTDQTGVCNAWDSSSDAYKALHNGSSSVPIFPLIPSGLYGGNLPDGTPSKCTVSLWNLSVFQVLIYKALGLLNWILFVFALSFTVYAGVLYISGFANEGNVKKARGILVGTYVGLIIALSARLIMGGVVAAFGDSNTTNALKSPDSQTIINGN